jgi:hypothetical protein
MVLFCGRKSRILLIQNHSYSHLSPPEVPIKPFITVVSGLPRSGTSMLMRMIEAGGMEILADQNRVADEDNPRGYYEFGDVKGLPGNTVWIPDARGKAVKIISHLLYHLPPEEQYRVIFINRDMTEILASQKKMLERRGIAATGPSDTIMAGKFSAHLDQISTWLTAQKHITVLSVQYKDILASPHDEVGRVVSFLELPLDHEAMKSAVDKSLYRNRRS